jgi:hypothetical protein
MRRDAMRTRGLAGRSGFASLFCLCVAVFGGLQRRLGTPPSLPAFARLAETNDAFGSCFWANQAHWVQASGI